METAGSVVVEIGGNLSPLEAAFAKGEQMAVAFNAKLTATLSGSGLSTGLERIATGVETTNALLGKLTTSGTSAGATMAKLVTATQPVTAALQQVTAATAATNAEIAKIGTSAGAASFGAGTISAKEFAAALEATGGNLSKITPQMLGMAAAEDAVAVSTEAATAAFRGLTEAQVQAFAVQQEGRNFNLALNESFGLINSTTKSARDSAAVFREMAVAEGEVAASGRTAAASMTALGAAETEAAGLGAGVTREFMVLGSEVARGNFSRIPGSLIVMNERLAATGTSVLTLANFTKMFGALGATVFNPFVLGFLAISIGTEVAARFFEKIYKGGKEATDVLKEHADELNKILTGYTDAQKAAQGYIDTTTKMPQPAVASDLGAKAATDLKAYQDALASVKAVQVDFIENYIKTYEAAKDIGKDTAQADNLKALQQQFSVINPDLDGLITKLTQIKNDPGAYEMVRTMADAMLTAAKNAKTLGDTLGATQTAFASLGGRNSSSDNMIANMISAGNAAADALKKADDNLGTSGMTSYAKAIANINSQFDDAIVKAHAAGAALDGFNQARDISIQEASLKALGGIKFDQSIAGADAFGTAITSIGSAAAGVKVELGGMAEPIINVTRLFGQAKLDELIGITSASQKLEGMKTELGDVKDQLDALSKLPADALFGAGDKGTAADITNAYNAIDEVFKRYDAGTASVRTVHDEIERVRATLMALGGDSTSVNEVINAFVQGQERVRQLNGDVLTLHDSIAHLPDKTVTITVVTRQVGSGTQSIYDVPNSSGGTSGVGVTRYGGTGAGPSLSAYSVPSTGYGSQGGSGDSSTGTVNVTRFATGGIIHPGDSQKVSFFKNPAETVGIFTPGQMDALANPQSAFTGTQATANDNRVWTVMMNIEANTRKTAQLLDDIKTSGSFKASSSSGSGSSSNSSIGSGVDPATAQFLSVLADVKSNFRAAGIVGGGNIGYGSTGLGATPEQIARAIISGGQSPVGYPSGGSSIGSAPTALRAGDPYNAMLNGISPSSPGYASAYAQALAASNKAAGFASGGMIAAGDTQSVQLFKSPDEVVAIFTPQQVKALRGENNNQPAAANADTRPIQITQHNYWSGNAPPAKESLAEVRRQTALGTRDALGSVYGR